VGRGRPYQQFSGNVFLHDLIRRDYVEEYGQPDTGRYQKTCIMVDAMNAMKELGGRFLERTNEGWKVVSDQVARKKVNSAFRSALAEIAL